MFLLTLLLSFGTLQAQNLCSSFSTEPVARTFGPGVTFLSSLHPNGATFPLNALPPFTSSDPAYTGKEYAGILLMAAKRQSADKT